ncbi:hypothetical protein HBH56_046240 [Parastagonospora nodorum]|uniref:RRM domain-containing protein n=1 Tax=Phaeosphaeria nodorum (strain SN15 / ATCC MYA-4574 / FGSC 10173) TaxID=321614 RepID=A0A7U2HW95_PHANO|nr:hypothetical protein HBH56_046240 [Parastagonospora nodorum]QRC92624.1 hypothetical protein JI435_083210 [Parastagonospora nodorum SN15]KAH3933406.1 hypothetical protein HBH54_073990 [Parastagonospora nodorum]KAH4139844.1 hypothetical protein HBH45_089720 [Parastagonospora nodorum]KAH4168979.1 hypothetical protein HBH44_046910 [Parastagonospora nodorum]
MVTVAIGKSYFEALLRRAEFVSVLRQYLQFPSDVNSQHTSHQDVDFSPNLFDHVTISKAEHEYLLQSERDYHLLRSALFRGGLTTETLETLLEGEGGASGTEEPSHYDYHTGTSFPDSKLAPPGLSRHYNFESSPVSEGPGLGGGLHHDVQPREDFRRGISYGQPESSIDSATKNDRDQEHGQRVPLHNQRTVLIANLSEQTTHKDLVGIIRGGRLLDIFLRNDRTATVSFVEGAAEFLLHAKRNDIYLHTKRLEFRWADRQFHVPSHVANKIANGATRNLLVRGVGGKLSADQIRDHLDHIHNLVVVDIKFRNGDAYISTNSIHNALFGRTCMMSRTAYKGLRIEYYPDECAAPLPQFKVYMPTQPVPFKPKTVTNTYALLDTGSDADSCSENDSYITEGVRIDQHQWRHAAVV